MDALTYNTSFVVQAILSLYLLAMFLRFLLQLVRADFYNPISQFLVKITNPLVLPTRKAVAGVGGLDLATLLLSLVLQLVIILAGLLLKGGQVPNLLVLVLWAVLELLALLINIYFFAVLANVILSWVAPGTRSPAAYLVYQILEPVMAPVRKVVPPLGGLDFSPLVVILLISVMQDLLNRAVVGLLVPAGLAIGL